MQIHTRPATLFRTLALVATFGGSLWAAPFTNGSFELPQLATNTWRGLQLGDTSMPGWTVLTSPGPAQANGFNAAWSIGPLEGSQYLLFNVGSYPSGGSIAQTFDTLPGTNYVVSFNVGKEGGAPGPAQITATVTATDGSVLAMSSVPQATTGWGPTNLLGFTATTPISTLTFCDTSPDTANMDLALDNVSIGLERPAVQAGVISTLHSFAGNPDGAYPLGVILAGNTLYGTTEDGGVADWGSPGNGTVFSVHTDGTGYTVLHTFTGRAADTFSNSDGAIPAAGLVLSGNTLYGTTIGGGIAGSGTLFEINTDGTGFAVLRNFMGGEDADCPLGGLVLCGGVLYGTSQYGGVSTNQYGAGSGTVFSVTTNGTGLTLLHSFPSTTTDGIEPYAGLVLAGNLLYGTTQMGGSGDSGTVFSIRTDGTAYTILHSFPTVRPGYNGGAPEAVLTLSGSTLYGTATFSGPNGYGTIFAINTDGTGFTVLHYFSGADGSYPMAPLVLSGSTLYGAAHGGGATGSGTLFGINTNGSGFSVLASFTGANGGGPLGGLVLAGNTVYGTTTGGTSGNGSVFAVTLPTIPFGAPPVIFGQPQSLVLAAGSPANFSVMASGSAPMTYQWQANGTNLTDNLDISGSACPTLTIKAASLTHCGTYQVILSNFWGMATSSVALLEIPHAATGTAQIDYGFLVGITLTDGGSGYTSAPVVHVLDGGGTGAEAVAVVRNGVVISLSVLDAGYGYTNLPSVIIDPPSVKPPALLAGAATFLGFTDLTAGSTNQLQICTAGTWTNVGAATTAVGMTYGLYVDGRVDGGDYRMVPVAYSSASATATALVTNGFVVGATLTSGGYGYVSAPVVELVGGGGTGAEAVAVVSNGVVTAVNVLHAGYGYTNTPVIAIAPPPVPAITPKTSPAVRLDYRLMLPNAFYQLLSASAFSNWASAGTAFLATNSTATIYLDATNQSGFYRLQWVP